MPDTTTLKPGSRPACGPLRTAAAGAGLGGLALVLPDGVIPPEYESLVTWLATVGGTYLGTIIRNVAAMRPNGPTAFIGRMLGLVPLP